jgi:hypothetical protein
MSQPFSFLFLFYFMKGHYFHNRIEQKLLIYRLKYKKIEYKIKLRWFNLITIFCAFYEVKYNLNVFHCIITLRKLIACELKLFELT